MKKTIAILAIAAVVYACSGAKSTEAADSTVTVTDTTAVSGNGQVPTDTVK